MALTGLEIYKLLPKTNCKECGFPTCLAFALKLAAKGAELSACPHVSEESKAALESASAPPIRLVTIGSGDRKIEIGNEIVLFRHDKTFYHQPGLAFRVKDSQPVQEVAAAVKEAGEYFVERVGICLALDLIAVENVSGEPGPFVECVKAVRANAQQPLILISRNPASIEAALSAGAGDRPLIYAADGENWEAMAALAKKYGCPLAVRGKGDLEELATLADQLVKAGVNDLVLDPGSRDLAGTLAHATQMRRLAIKKNFRPLGFPTITFPGEGAESIEQEAIAASQQIAKYAGLVVLDHFNPCTFYPLLTLRQNIYTDPQKPIQVTPGVYKFNEPGPNSPVLITTNFSLTYFSVAGEVETSNVPTWLVIADAEGLSVLTAWAAGKFSAESIAKTVKSCGLGDDVERKVITLPGLVATLSGELEEELPGWKVAVGPREAVDIQGFLKSIPRN
ncbi:MAG: acetyl-CoA decarbonylase/synthase complex subunit gamma [Chloroflexota bacterium]